MMDDRETMTARVARRLRAARITARMTVREVAAVLAISHTLIVKYENGTVAPSFERLDALARVYGLTPAALLAEHDETVPLLAAIEQASAAQLAHLAHVLEHPPT
jgi:transcriptional regulator with XRE-family HTH domain